MQKTSEGFNNRIRLFIYLVVSVVLVVAFFIFGKSLENATNEEASNAVKLEIKEHELNRLSPSWLDKSTEMSSDITIVDLASVNEIYTITDQGDYLLSGNYEGQILVDAIDSNVHLFMDGCHIKSHEGPAIKCVEANKLVITLVEGSDNSVADSGDYNDADEDATIFSNASLTINGEGKLGIDGLYKDAIHSKDIVKIVSGEVFVKASRNGINASDGVAISGGEINISSKKDGIQTSSLGANGKGSILIEDGNVSIISGKNGLSAKKGSLYVTGGKTFVNSVAGTYSIAEDVYINEGCINE